jgi:hypothetical protein
MFRGVAVSDTEPTAEDIRVRKGALMRLFDRLLPVVDAIADSVRFAALLGLVMVVWIFVWMTRLHELSLATGLAVTAVASMPVLVLLWYWWGLEGVKKLPETVAQMAGSAGAEVRSHIQGIRAGETRKLLSNVSLGNLWELRSLAGEARELLGSYARFGALASPILLVLLFLSLLLLIPLGLVSLALAVQVLLF